METFDAISQRASIREYQTKSIGKELLEKLVDAGRRAPTARAVEPWEFVAITNKETLKKLGQIANTGPFIKDAAASIAVFCQDTKYYLEDGCAATENILLAAADLGLGADLSPMSMTEQEQRPKLVLGQSLIPGLIQIPRLDIPTPTVPTPTPQVFKWDNRSLPGMPKMSFFMPKRKGKNAWEKRYMWEFPVKGAKEMWKKIL